jgi:hypothetical protein
MHREEGPAGDRVATLPERVRGGDAHGEQFGVVGKDCNQGTSHMGDGGKPCKTAGRPGANGGVPIAEQGAERPRGARVL